MLKETMTCAISEEQEERELYYEVAANYQDFGLGVGYEKKPDADFGAEQIAELNRLTQGVQSTASLLDRY